MRARWGVLLVGALGAVGVLGGGCAHKKPPPAAPQPSPAPKGDLLRFKANAGDQPKAHITLLIAQDVAAKQGDKGGARHIEFSFTMNEEETVDAVAPDGTAQISSRLVDVAGTAGEGARQEQVDDFALALDELKIQFRRSPRGEVASVTMTGVRSPLDDKTARAILNAIYGAARGPILPEDFVDVGATWNTTTSVPTPFGSTAEATYAYKYAAKDGGVAVVSAEGTLDSKPGPGVTKRLAGKNQSEYRLDVASGRLKASSSDVMTQVEEQVAGQQTLSAAVKQRVKVTWTRTSPAQ